MSPHPRVGREHILDMAEKLFTEHGFKSASIREIARACGVTNAAIYYHFPDKESLFVEVMQRHAENLRDRMAAAGAKINEPRERLIAILKAYVDEIAEQRAPIFMLRKDMAHRQIVIKHGEKRVHLMQSVSQPIVETLSLGQEAGQLKSVPSADEASGMLLGMLHGLGQQRRVSGAEGRILSEEDIRMAVELFWKGLAI